MNLPTNAKIEFISSLVIRSSPPSFLRRRCRPDRRRWAKRTRPRPSRRLRNTRPGSGPRSRPRTPSRTDGSRHPKAPTRSSELHSDHIQRVLPPLSRPIIADDGGVGVVVVSVPSTSPPPTLLPDGRPRGIDRVQWALPLFFYIAALVHKNSLHVECTRDSLVDSPQTQHNHGF
jgi:hypothetical protein